MTRNGLIATCFGCLLIAGTGRASARGYIRGAIILILFFSLPVWAVNPQNHISQYGHSVWRIQDGYFNGLVYAVAQTSDGYLWIGTEAGLLRFDGVRFVAWSPPAGQQLPSPTIFSLLGTADGSLWIGTRSGVSRWFNQKLTNLDIHGGVGNFLEDKDQSVWFVYGGQEDVLCHAVETTAKCYGEKDGITGPQGPLVRDSAGNFWLSTRHGVIRWQKNSFSTYNASALQSMEGVEDSVATLAVTPEGAILVGMAMPGHGLGLQQLRDGIWKSYQKPGLDGTKITAAKMLVDRQGALWIGTLQQGLYRVYGDSVEHFGSADGLSGDFVRSMYEDREGNLWVGTSKGVDLFRNLRVVTFSTHEGLGTEEVDSILAASDGTVWVGGAESLDAMRHDGISSVRTGKGLPGGQVGALFEDHTGQLWVGVDQNLFLYKNGRFKPITRSDGSQIGLVGRIVEDRNNDIWMSVFHENRVRLLRIHDFKIQEELSSPQVPPARMLATDSDGNLRVAPSNGGLAQITNGRAEILFESKGDPRVMQLVRASDGSLLGATDSGVIAWRNNQRRLLTTQSGLPCNTVHALINDAAGNLWLNLHCGLAEITDADLKKWWQNPDMIVHPRVFDVFDGARPGHAPWGAAARSADGRLWFANGSVLQMVDPAQISENGAPPPVHIERIDADRKDYLPQNGVAVPALTRELQIDYTALSLGVPQKVLFRYLLEGHDGDWQEAGTRRQAFYNDLHPGHYRFRVIACNNDGIWNEAGASLDFSILPAYYQTTWFRIVWGAALLVSLWAIYQFRVRQLRRQFSIGLEARVNERTRIARELHDTLLQSFNALLLRFQTASDLLSTRPDEAKRTLDSTIDQTAQALIEGRDAVQQLRPTSLATSDLVCAIGSLGQALADGLNGDAPAFHLEVEGTPQDLLPITRDEIYRIAGEALRNAFRHARARRIEVDIRYDARQLRLHIRDDGQGIDPQLLRTDGLSGHYGLRGMRERAQSLGGELTIWSEVNSGTEIDLTVPSSIAYTKPGLSRLRILTKRRQTRS
jgi:signal transduction histidine kinase/streptogramin lyase